MLDLTHPTRPVHLPRDPPAATVGVGSLPMSSRVSNLELIATWSLPRPMIWGEQEAGGEAAVGVRVGMATGCRRSPPAPATAGPLLGHHLYHGTGALGSSHVTT